MSENKPLNGKIAVVTGSTRGIGKACALKLAALGAKVVVCWYSSSYGAEATLKYILEMGGDGFAIKVNVADSGSVKELFAVVEKEYGGADILVNNAGIYMDKPLLETTEEDIELLFKTNISGVYYCVRSAARYMMKNRYGKIINITSAAAFLGISGLSAYSAAKGAVAAFTKAAAKELASRNICVNAVAPGLIDTDMNKGYTKEVLDNVLKNAMFKRLGEPNDVAETVAFLAGKESDYITGQVFHVNGGIYI